MSDPIEIKDLTKAVDGVKTGFEAYKEANDLRLKEIEEKGQADPILDEKLEKIDKDITASQKRLDDFHLSLKRKSFSKDGVNADELDAKALAWAKMVAKSHGTNVTEFGNEAMDGYKTAYNKFLRKGDEIIDIDSKKALSVGSDPDGGYVVHPDMSGQIVQRVFESSPMRQYAAIQVISTDQLDGLIDADEAASGWVAETAARPETGTPQLDKWSIPVHELYANPRATQKLLDDASINMESWLAGKVAEKFGRDESTAFVTGNGVGKPRGFLDYGDWATAGTYEIGAIEQFDSGVDGGFAAAPAGGDILITALYGLKQQYRNNATWFMNRGVTATVRKLKDSDGAYIWQPSIAAGQPSTLVGYPVAAFEDMPALATGSLSIAVGDMRSAYQIVDRMGIRTLRDPYSAKPYVQFYTVKRVGGDVVDFDAIKLINFKA